VDGVSVTKSIGIGLSVRALSFQDFQPMRSQSTNVTDGQADGQTTCDRNTALCTIVHRAVKTECHRKIVIWQTNQFKTQNFNFLERAVRSRISFVKVRELWFILWVFFLFSSMITALILGFKLHLCSFVTCVNKRDEFSPEHNVRFARLEQYNYGIWSATTDGTTLNNHLLWNVCYA